MKSGGKGVPPSGEVGIWVVAFQSVQNKAVLIQDVGGILVLADVHWRNQWAVPRNLASKQAIVYGIV